MDNFLDNTFIIKKRKGKRKQKRPQTYNILQASKVDNKYFLGKLSLGLCNEDLPIIWNSANAYIASTSDEDLFIFKHKEVTYEIVILIDAPFINSILQSKLFSINFEQENKNVSLLLHLTTLPIVKYTTKVCNTIKKVFHVLFDISEDINLSQNDAKIVEPADMVENVSQVYQRIREMQTLENDYEVLSEHLKPILRPYQQKAVRWMISKERKTCIEKTKHPSFCEITLSTGLKIYYDKYAGIIELKCPMIEPLRTGGILADEMGLGKTVEFLACLLSQGYESSSTNKKLSVHNQHRKKRLKEDIEDEPLYIPPTKMSKIDPQFIKKGKSSLRDLLENWYKSELQQSKKKIREPNAVQCICGNNSRKQVVNCVDCNKKQHATCMGFKEEFGEYRCPQCWTKQPLLPSKGTLIVCPTSLRKQWITEICKHVRSQLKILEYEASPNFVPIYPVDLLSYDIVITTYNVLQTQLRLVQVQEAKVLRNQSKYSSAGSPICLINWFRLCLDEAQIVENGAVMISEMAQKLHATHRWAITGTPISVSISDIYGLINYLQLEPYNDKTIFDKILYIPYMNGNKQPMLEFLSKVMWRTQKNDVLDQICIPAQSIKEYKINFSLVERYFYDREYELSYNDFLQKLQNYNPNLPLISIKNCDLKNVLAPVISLRRACVHHNAVKGRYLLTKKPVNSMEALLDALIARNLNECEEHLRIVISSLNGMAGIYLLLQRPPNAISEYRRVLQLSAKFSKDRSTPIKLSVDKPLLIHAMHNLADILEMFPTVEKTLHDDTLRDDCKQLELKYLDKFNKQTIGVIQNVNKINNEIIAVQDNLELEQGQWYSAILAYIFNNRLSSELIQKLETFCGQNFYQKNISFVNSETKTTMLLINWEQEIENLRDQALTALNDLYNIENDKVLIKNRLVEMVADCHLRPTQKRKSIKKKCVVCEANDVLKKYESQLFIKLEKEKSWKPSFEENILKVLLQIGKNKKIDFPIIQEGDTTLTIYELYKKEFKEIRKLWTYLDAQICAIDEIDISKMRLQLKVESDENLPKNQALKNLSYNIENKMANINQLSQHELDFQLCNIESEGKEHYKQLEHCLGTHKYLNTLHVQQNTGQNPDPCPICKSALDTQWNILKCGHCYCIDCLQVLLGKSLNKFIFCSICRVKQSMDDINFVDISQNQPDDDNVKKIKGNCSTKIEAIVKLILKLKEEDAFVKILLFSNWAVILKVCKTVFRMNGISAEILTTANVHSKLKLFKDLDKGVTVLLMPVTLGSKGLNLVEATHLIIVEPILDPADELQAIGRIHRIGQTKTTVVHKFLIKNTIEENIHTAISKCTWQWNKAKVTLKQIKDLFIKISNETCEIVEEQ